MKIYTLLLSVQPKCGNSYFLILCAYKYKLSNVIKVLKLILVLHLTNFNPEKELKCPKEKTLNVMGKQVN